ncbi:MAG TPA: bifunctional serine/threonine-protein kinase/formylglycine-generating enzyme family protein, partial [Acidobacteriota bacterium]|nr:bifunctional serine/threonine-protein kinase/formylglycine-generating enzyme family protein [Acidobacteriota bacterium]
MGEVYLAEDFSLNRLVALKILPKQFVADEDRLHRFIREAKTASAISHSGVAHIYEIGEAEGTHFIAMEYVEGSTLAKKVEKGPLEYHQVISITLELASALQAAHSKGIIHRDIKPSNVMITSSGAAKLLDFGLSKVTNEEKDPKSWLSTLTKTQSGLVLGTIPYMSPEQLRGLELDHRTDFFSLGTLLHQISTGRHPFQENTAIGIAQSIMNEESIPVHQINNKIPTSFSKIVSKLLEKNREDRYQNVADILEDLKRVELDKTEGPKWLTVIRKPAVAFLLLLGLIAISAVFIRTVHHSSKVRWARDEALLEITRLIDQGKYSEAVELGNEAQKFIPEDPLLKSLWSSMSITVSIQTRPSGAEISTEDYESPSDKWKAIGISPISELRIPKGYTRWKITKSGFRPLYVVIPRAFWETEVQLNFLMEPESEIPSGMTRIPGLKSDSLFPLTFTIMPVEEDYWMDQFEVSNKEFKKFVDSSGYQNSKYWRVPFVKDGKELRFEEAMNYFHDSTGRPGPLHWEVGNYPRGEDGYPVTGVSWYEAAAYAEFAGKSLPTIHHWMRAAGDGMNYEIIRFSNFNSNGPILASDVRSMNPFGNYNMAGNVKEWCWNESDTGTRFILGGSYLEPVYKF